MLKHQRGRGILSQDHTQFAFGERYRRAISMVGRALASSQLDGCYGPFRMSASTWTRLLLSKALFREENCRSAVLSTCLVFKIAFNEADDTVFCFTYRKKFKEKKNKTSTKADSAFVKVHHYSF